MSLQIIGAGYGRTGTMSLKLAIEQLGFGPCFHMSEAIANQACIPDWLEATRGRAHWEKIFGSYRATVDHPGCAFYRELADAYPDAKVVLTVRDANEWFDSTQATVFSPLMRGRIPESPFREFMEKTVWGLFGTGIDDRAFMVEAFARHSEEVRRAIPKDRLLVFEVTSGWKPLCDFLGVAVPAAPFPRVNSREEMAAMLALAASHGANMSPEGIQAAARERLGRLPRH
jgi:hypothetical protein